MVKLSTVFFTLAAVAYASAGLLYRRAVNERTVSVESKDIFCTFLPPDPGDNVGDTEDRAIAFCTQETSGAPGAKIFPPGFITSVHFKDTGSYVQVTGTIDRDAYSLNASDGGGQYDNHGPGSPHGASCTGYKKFVNLLEPDAQLYCIRCCHDPNDCPTGESTKGCKVVIPGDYS